MAFNADLDLSRERTLQSRVWELSAENAKMRGEIERLRARLRNIVDIDEHRYDGDLRDAVDMAREALKD